ncbi:hypothetical protein E2C01_005384 [Portunus trituberculatus]|uniref:Uncharacterized protein n=1 Tax=Portunus trituberculatus TaxID=210409 RepID=A0A5B7CT77_PORTR|nr:hypothetical protein [Portunus trituberculatus]
MYYFIFNGLQPLPPSMRSFQVGALALFTKQCKRTSDEQNDVHYPPYANTTKGKQFSHSCPSVAKTEAIHAQEPKQHTVDEGSYKIVTTVPGMDKESKNMVIFNVFSACDTIYEFLPHSLQHALCNSVENQ